MKKGDDKPATKGDIQGLFLDFWEKTIEPTMTTLFKELKSDMKRGFSDAKADRQEMKHQIINQTRAILTPSLVVTFASFDDRHNKANFRVENFSRENIALNFQGEIFFKDSKIDEKRIAVISYGGAGTKGFYPDSIVFPFNVSEEHYDDRDKLRFEYSYYDRTGKFKFKGLIKSLHRDGLRGNFQRHLKRKKIYMA